MLAQGSGSTPNGCATKNFHASPARPPPPQCPPPVSQSMTKPPLLLKSMSAEALDDAKSMTTTSEPILPCTVINAGVCAFWNIGGTVVPPEFGAAAAM